MQKTQEERKEMDRLRAALAEEENAGIRTEIRAPFTSFVVARYTSPGEKVTASTPLFLFARESPNLAAELEVPQEDLKRLRFGAPAQIVSESAPGHTLDGEITEIRGPAPGDADAPALGRVIVEAPKDDGGFVIGSRVAAQIEIVREEAAKPPGAPPSPRSGSRGTK